MVEAVADSGWSSSKLAREDGKSEVQMSWSPKDIEDAIAQANARLADPNLSRDDRFVAEAERDVCKELAAMLREEASEPVMAMGDQ